MTFKRSLYLAYYFKRMNWPLLTKFLKHSSKESGRSKISLLLSSIESVFKYNISILEYFQFAFYKKSKEEKKKWAGTGTMYEFQLKANPLRERVILDDKRLFFKKYNEYFVHKQFVLEELKRDKNIVEKLLKEEQKVVLKEATGKCGSGVKIITTTDTTVQELIGLMEKDKFDLLETYIKQHKSINELSPSAVNTVRVFTQIRKDGEFEILGCRLRISVNCDVDNLAAGNLAAPIDENTGRIVGPAIYSDITKEPEIFHPITGIKIVGFQIPFWDEILHMVKVAALKYPQNRSIGWDVVVTENGPGLIEGNHDWCKLVWQLPVHEGLKSMLDV